LWLEEEQMSKWQWQYAVSIKRCIKQHGPRLILRMRQLEEKDDDMDTR
jgi:hypothetical protein